MSGLPAHWRVWNEGQVTLFVRDVFTLEPATERHDIEVVGVQAYRSGLELTAASGRRYVLTKPGLKEIMGDGRTFSALVTPMSRFDPDGPLMIHEVMHPRPRVDRMALAVLARLAPDPEAILAQARDTATREKRQAQIAIPSSDGTDDKDTHAVNLRLDDGELLAAVGYRGLEIGHRQIVARRSLPEAIAAAARGRPLSDIMRIDLLAGFDPLIHHLECYEDGSGMVIQLERDSLPLGDDAAIAAMVAEVREQARKQGESQA